MSDDKNNHNKNAIKYAVKEHYENLAKENLSVNGEAEKITASIGYAAEDLTGIPKEADMGFGSFLRIAAAKPHVSLFRYSG